MRTVFVLAIVLGMSAQTAYGVPETIVARGPEIVTVAYRIDLDLGVRVPTGDHVRNTLQTIVTASAAWARLVPVGSNATVPTIEIGAYPIDDRSSPAHGILTTVVRDARGAQLAAGTIPYTADAVAVALNHMAVIVMKGLAQIPHRARIATLPILTVLESPPVPSGWSRPYRVVGVALTGAGVATLGVAGWQALEWQSSVEIFRGATDQPTRFSAKVDGEQAGATANLAFGVGGAIVAVGITMLILDLTEVIGGSSDAFVVPTEGASVQEALR